MDELIDILNEDGSPTGTTELKSVAHANGLFHPTIHVWCYSLDGYLLLQQRGRHKETYPLKWDVSAAGHIGAGESPQIGAFRECQEELGITIEIENLQKITIYKKEKKHSNRIFDREFINVFIYELDKSVALTKQESEVEALEWISIKDFESWISQKHQGLIPNSEKRFEFVISEIQKRLKDFS
ncbi:MULTISPECIES: NUDIX hydrolase [Croceitalea]|uniref:NUDIX domain-containing protein n=1 Tax=Croceitalea vernalis TaxID=3075599 RepID=A0ABU3BI69_9FLAO|nr:MULTISPECIES: NUDIX domain-containing protein [unclassified Croceitalea]MDT0540019.1 NUDIX domain-containing protein [Croceitalea sp. P059]MDT0621839.1 NUDIX domain-containing protein [Croceitalea sp. P007]